VDATATYTDPGPVNGVVRETLKLRGTVGLVNAYWDLRPRGSFTPYVGAGIGFVYNDIDRTHLTTEDSGAGPVTVRTGSGKDSNIGFAGALMAGASFAVSHAWALDVGYRALFLDGGEVTTTLSSAETSTAKVGSYWEHQVRVGLRMNIW
jgi:opacity protein-like surface antigen